MREYRQLSRTERYKKRRNMKRSIYMFTSLGALFLFILFFLIIFGQKEPHDPFKEERNEHVGSTDSEIEENDEQGTRISDDKENEKNESSDESNSDQEDLLKDVIVEQVESADDNVIVAYSGNWPPIGTTQTGEHVIDYSDGSQDRIEIKRAVSLVTNIPENDMIEHWIGNDGEQKVHATVSSRTTNEFYRVYLSWIDGEGWQPTKVEKLKEYRKP